jgi:uncharacterized protein
VPDSAAVSPEQLRAALKRRSGLEVQQRETHISWVFLVGERAYKLKKPLVLPFLDYGTPERRREMCEYEVTLNRRLAPEVYLGIRAVLTSPSGVEVGDEHAAGAIDYVVEMRRYDEQSTLAARLDRGELRREEVADLGRRLAAFHDTCPPVTGDLDRVRTEVERNLGEVLAVAELRAETQRIGSMSRLLRWYLRTHVSVLRDRAARGCVRECHGDLRAEHVVLGGSPTIVDCVEFDPRLRQLDVADDLAFLFMDLTARGGARFARELVEAYRRAGGDTGDDALLAFFAVHRALVRTKVLLVRASQYEPESAAHGHLSVRARGLLAVAEQFGWQARLPLTLVVCGVPATGKSELASALAQEAQLPWLSSDAVRKRLSGLVPTARAPRSKYREQVNRETYAELGRRAAAAARNGGSIVDGTFRHRSARDAFMRTFADATRLRFVQCTAPTEVLRRRALAREHDPGRVSDATIDVVIRERASWESLDEVPDRARMALDTDRALDQIVADVIEWLDETP